MNIGKRIYYDTLSGNVLVDTGERSGSVIELTVEQEIEIYNILAERRRDTFDVIRLEYGQYRQDFTECNGYRVNPETKELEFSYPDPNEPEQPPVYQEPLSTQVEKLKERQDATENALLDLLLGGM